MATEIDGETNGCIFEWKIENISHCWLKNGKEIRSPVFIADALEDTKWSLWLYPMGDRDDKNVGIYLARERDFSGPNEIEVNYQIAFLDKNGTYLTERTLLKRVFGKERIWGFSEFEAREKVFITKRKSFLPEDTLTVQCTIWIKYEYQTLVKPDLCFARTVFKVNRKSFLWQIPKFSTLKPGLRSKFQDDLIDFDIVLNEIEDLVKKLDIDIISFNENIKYFLFRISIINSYGEKEPCGEHEYFASDIEERVLSTPLFSKMLMKNETRYLSNDVLLLDCEYVTSNGLFRHEVVTGCGILSSKLTKVVVEKERSQHSSVLASDLKLMYEDGSFSDTELRTSTQTFKAHKSILSARSPVFRRMFSNDMKEKNSGRVDITDLEENTVHRMLLYVYTDTLEDLQLESACNLYVAADKYEILSLRSRCSSFLKDSLCPKKACDILALADRHQDDDLKIAVQDFILTHDKEVFGSQKWKDFIDTNPKLAADIMYWKVFPG
ncbi:Speckle-type POZ protein [Araneus ventricosus]|uniref:Speckle-type POZ protein n=1 Tax=Araneus ventricosus TaxID=182803 RepID=A0A4Y2M8Y7_ARAVE|nr:Speckle-type POZ protein [Araneus ventricosus]